MELPFQTLRWLVVAVTIVVVGLGLRAPTQLLPEPAAILVIGGLFLLVATAARRRPPSDKAGIKGRS